MELLQLKYFCDAAQTQNFSHTAKKFFVPPSSVSQAIKRLELELGTPLFVHNGNKVFLAETGKRFYEKVKSALALLEEAKSDAVLTQDEMAGSLSLLVSCNRRLVSQAIPQFTRDYPQAQLILHYTQPDTVGCDIVISEAPLAGYCEKALLVTENILLAVNRSHPLAQKEQVSLSDLYGEAFICMPKGHSLYTITENICSRAGFLPSITIQTNDTHYIRKYVELGLGITFVPEISWQGLFSPDVVLKNIGPYSRKTILFLPKGKEPSRISSVFLEYLNKVFKQGEAYANFI